MVTEFLVDNWLVVNWYWRLFHIAFKNLDIVGESHKTEEASNTKIFSNRNVMQVFVLILCDLLALDEMKGLIKISKSQRWSFSGRFSASETGSQTIQFLFATAGFG